MPKQTPRLWEIDHPYYAAEGHLTEHASFAELKANVDAMDEDMKPDAQAEHARLTTPDRDGRPGGLREAGMWRRTSDWLEQWTGAEWKPIFRTPEGEAREAALDAATHDVRRDFIVEALSWAETTHDGRLGNERAEMLLASHDAALTAKAKVEAWDEGFEACFDVSGDAHKQDVPNPYRADRMTP